MVQRKTRRDAAYNAALWPVGLPIAQRSCLSHAQIALQETTFIILFQWLIEGCRML
jgi:hypothetical protein